MPAYQCKCKSRVSVGEIPCKNQWNFISDLEYDNWHGKIDSEKLLKEMNMFFSCPQCHRVAIFWEGWNEKPTFYQEEK